jgi:hypothetical protein
MYPGTIPWALREIGQRLDDRETDGTIALYVGSTTSDILPTRAVDQLNEAQYDVFWRLLDESVGLQQLQQEVTLTATSGSTNSHDLPTRTARILKIRESTMDEDCEGYPAVDEDRDCDYGYGIGPRGETIKWHNFDPNPGLSYLAKIIRIPAVLSYGTVGQAETATTNVRLASTPTYGYNMLADDEYNGEQITILTGTGKELIGDITDYDGSVLDCTVSTAWSLGETDTYSLRCSLPRNIWRAWIAKACARIAYFYRPSFVSKAEEEAEVEYQRLVSGVMRPLQAAYGKPRIVVNK